ncbi:MAG TPA: hypothetical protein VHI78_01480 [Bacteroidales bacterium]|nr:hypothetical protein [Bacteroidales bacterium]
MDRKDFTRKLALLGACPFVVSKLFANETANIKDEDIKVVEAKKQFVENWLADLLDSIEKNLDRETQEKLIAYCGVACFNRHQFKKDIAITSNGSLDQLIENYKKNFEIWREGNQVHIRYGEVSNQCYCPAANYRASKPNDIHCECTRNTHKTIFETALGKPFRVEVAESLRRGGKTCHFVVYLD